jgi:hypothetical protein
MGCACYESDNIPGTCYRAIPRTPAASPVAVTERERLGFAVWEVGSPCFADEELNGSGPIYAKREEAEDYLAYLENDVDGSPRGSHQVVEVYLTAALRGTV